MTDDARTDTIVIVSLDTKYNRVILTSILRDSKINNPRGNETKINLCLLYTSRFAARLPAGRRIP